MGACLTSSASIYPEPLSPLAAQHDSQCSAMSSLASSPSLSPCASEQGARLDTYRGRHRVQHREVSPRLVALLRRPSNSSCADCGLTLGDPAAAWASLKFRVVVCVKCAGVHRSVGAGRVKSFTLDNWDKQAIECLECTSNWETNSDYERFLDSNSKPVGHSTMAQRTAFIIAKYVQHRFRSSAAAGQSIQQLGHSPHSLDGSLLHPFTGLVRAQLKSISSLPVTSTWGAQTIVVVMKSFRSPSIRSSAVRCTRSPHWDDEVLQVPVRRVSAPIVVTVHLQARTGQEEIGRCLLLAGKLVDGLPRSVQLPLTNSAGLPLPGRPEVDLELTYVDIAAPNS